MTMTGDQSGPESDEFTRVRTDGWGAVDDGPLRDALASQVLTLVAATITFLVLNPQSWIHGRTTAPEQAEIYGVVQRLMRMRAQDITEQCPLCSHSECVMGCPVSIARELVTRAGRQ